MFRATLCVAFVRAAAGFECFLPLCAFPSGGSLELVKSHGDIEIFRKATGASSVMLARAAMWNPSVFSEAGLLPVERVMEDYLKYVSFYIGIGIYFNIFIVSRHSPDSRPIRHAACRPSGTRTTPSMQSTACVRCCGTRWSLLWASRCSRRRPLPRLGSGMLGDCTVETPKWIKGFWGLYFPVLQRGVGPAGVLPADPRATAGHEGGPARMASPGRRRHHHGCQVWTVSASTHACI